VHESFGFFCGRPVRELRGWAHLENVLHWKPRPSNGKRRLCVCPVRRVACAVSASADEPLDLCEPANQLTDEAIVGE
jgi:hypothetical protein